jgi:O-6-methylguanine DNA methyltransferase
MEILHFADIDTAIGRLRVVSSNRGLVYVELPNANGRGLAGWMETYTRAPKLIEGYTPNRVAATQLIEFSEGKRNEFDVSLDLRATPFQLAVYEEVARIPFGESASYSQIAERISRPKAVRAVGAANGANPLPLVIPCHRVVGKSGKLQGYAGGLAMKAKLLALESSVPREGWLL